MPAYIVSTLSKKFTVFNYVIIIINKSDIINDMNILLMTIIIEANFERKL